LIVILAPFRICSGGAWTIGWLEELAPGTDSLEVRVEPGQHSILEVNLVVMTCDDVTVVRIDH